MVTDVKYKQILDLIIEIGGTFTVLSGIFYISTIYLIDRDWKKSVLDSIKNEEIEISDELLLEKL